MEEPQPLKNKKKKPPKIWHIQHERILKNWGEASSCFRYMHFKAYQYYKSLSFIFTLPVIILSTVTGTANFAQSTFPKDWVAYVPSVIGGLNLFAAILTTLSQFLKVSELMESHRVTAIHYGKLTRNIQLELALPVAERTHDGDNMVELCRSEYDRLIEQSPPVPKDIIKKFDTTFPDSPTSSKFTRPELTNIIPIEMFDNEKEEERIKRKIEKERQEELDKKKSQMNKYTPTKDGLMREISNLRGRMLVSSHPVDLESIQIEEPTQSVAELTKNFEDIESGR
jgi:hypothetical protein